MAILKKAVLKVGETMQSPDGLVPITAERLAHFAAQHKRLTAAKYDVPSRWEHADKPADMLPLATEELKTKLDGRHAVGKMVGFDYPAGSEQAELTLEISDSRAAEQCESNRVKVSPIIAGWWKDGHGNEYTDFISHADLVERPVDHTQGPFVKVPETIACSLEKWLPAATVRLAFPGDDDDTNKTPESLEEAAAAPDAPEAPPKNPDMPPKATDKTKCAAVLEGLKTKGIVLPSDFDFSGDAALDILLAAINSSVAADVKAQESQQEEQEEEEPATVASPGYSQMSTETKAAVEYANTIHRDRIKERLERLSTEGRCTPAEVKEQEAAVSTIRLSLDAEQKPIASDLEKWIKSREAVPKGTFWTPEQRTRLSAEVASPPDNMVPDPTDDEIDERVKKQLQRTGFAK